MYICILRTIHINRPQEKDLCIILVENKLKRFMAPFPYI